MGELKQRMSYPEFIRWQLFLQHEALGGERLDLHMALLMKTLIKLLGNQNVELDRLTPQFWPVAQTSEQELSADELHAKAKQIFGALNATQSNR